MKKGKDIKESLQQFVELRAQKQKDRMLFIVFNTGIIMFLVGLPFHHLGVLGINDPFLIALSAVFWVGSLVTILAYYRNPFPLDKGLELYGVAAQAMESARIIYLTLAQPEGYGMAIVVNQAIAFTIIMYQTIALIPRGAVVCTCINIFALLYALLYDTPSVPQQLVIIFGFLEVCICCFAQLSHRFVFTLEQDNDAYHKTQDGLLEAFHMSRAELVAYLQMSRSKSSDTKSVTEFFNLLDEQSEANLMKAAERRKAERLASRERFADLCPTLTPTELEVCRLIVAGKTLNEIAGITGKNANNISSVRIHIRRKLGLKPSDDLRQSLEKMCGKGA